MGEICPKCGLPKELCVCEAIARGEQQIKIKVVKRRFGKMITVVSGFDDKTINIKDLARKLKSKLACGGTTKEKHIELQGDHREKVKELIIAEGFPPSSITTKREIERK